MSRNRNKKKRRKDSDKEGLHQETIDSIIAVGAYLLALFFMLAWFGKAGVLGTHAYNGFSMLLGNGYFLLPITFVLIGTSLVFALKQKFLSLPMLGAGLFLLSSLGLAEIVAGDNAGGLVGSFIARPLVYLFDLTLTGIFFFAILIVSLLILFNASLGKVFSVFRWTPKEAEGEVDVPGEMLPNNMTVTDDIEDALEIVEEEEDIEEEFVPTPVAEHEQPEPEEQPAFLKTLKRRTKDYELPPVHLLSNDKGKPQGGDIKANANIVQRTLQTFGIPVEMGEVNIGPSVTQYTLKPAQGVKLSRIVNLQNDLALALAAHPLRIEAPIPGKSFVGIEIPNKSVATVGLKMLIEQDEFQKAGPLMFAVGKDVAGKPAYANLAKMPHLLIAGATGSGKSVTVHALITSLLYKNTPMSLRMIMIDPKRVELAPYSDIPHLMTPVITEPKEAVASLRWATKEMEERYRTLQGAGARDIVSYNNNTEDIMPYIVIVVDELADLMSTYGREVEAAIVRLAQMARAVGIHLVLSTQRPSVDVITGLIKANMPSRIALRVASQIDSRTILDAAGAEKLLGNGDMLVVTSDATKAKRIQGAFVEEKEVRKVARFVADQEEEKDYNEEIIQMKSQNGTSSFADDDADDELYEEAYKIVLEAQKASTSFLQRRLKVGYARAARLVDMLEERGVVGPGEGAKPREILIEPGVAEARLSGEGDQRGTV